MRNPTAAAHVLGKLLRHVGEDRVVWGTNSIWYGSPQDRIQAFRAFQIAESVQQRHDYPLLTATIKAKIFGLNAAGAYGVQPALRRKRAERDAVSRLKAAYRANPNPSFATHGPRNMAEFQAQLRSRGGMPA